MLTCVAAAVARSLFSLIHAHQLFFFSNPFVSAVSRNIIFASLPSPMGLSIGAGDSLYFHSPGENAIVCTFRTERERERGPKI